MSIPNSTYSNNDIVRSDGLWIKKDLALTSPLPKQLFIGGIFLCMIRLYGWTSIIEEKKLQELEIDQQALNFIQTETKRYLTRILGD